MTLNFPSISKCHSCMFFPLKTQNGMDDTQLPFDLKVSFLKTQNGMDDTQLPFDLKVLLLHLFPL
jgi:hypothetical protein